MVHNASSGKRTTTRTADGSVLAVDIEIEEYVVSLARATLLEAISRTTVLVRTNASEIV